ncbi:MAG: response regulator transcription factor [Gemmataceae bacterium]|nr:response regulator transcription factor [Gemmataceae bacterium]
MRVLAVETQQPQLHSLERSLEEGGFRVDTARDGEEANYKARTVEYDLVVLSLLLPKNQALTLLAEWRRDGLDFPILALASSGNLIERVAALDHGADDYLARPFQIAEFLARARVLVRRAHRVAAPVIRIHDLEINTNTRTVKRSGQMIRLTRREYALLQFLAFHRGKVVTRSMIWEHLYNERDETTSNVVDVYIRYLRNKIDKGFEPPLILTRRGAGYLVRGDDLPEPPSPGRNGSANGDRVPRD